MTTTIARAVSLRDIARIESDDPRVLRGMCGHFHAGMGTTHEVHCLACGRFALVAAQVVGAVAQGVCPGSSCRAVVRYEVTEHAVFVTTTRRK